MWPQGPDHFLDCLLPIRETVYSLTRICYQASGPPSGRGDRRFKSCPSDQTNPVKLGTSCNGPKAVRIYRDCYRDRNGAAMSRYGLATRPRRPRTAWWAKQKTSRCGCGSTDPGRAALAQARRTPESSATELDARMF